jgi:excisionase family DNA binding protein
MAKETEARTYKIGEAAKLLGIGRNQAYEAAQRGDIPCLKIGKRVLVPKAALDRMLEGSKAA